jgi:hypothetical protein
MGRYRMRDRARTLIGNLAGALTGAGAGAAAPVETVTGELISVWCYIQNRQNVGEAGYLCALADLKWEGNPPGILTSGGKVYQLAGTVLGENNAKVLTQIGRRVTITGEVTGKDGVRVLTASELGPGSR